MPKESEIRRIRGKGIPIPGDDIDTDRIIPARFMRCVTFDGLGAYAFYDARHDSEGEPLAHPMNDERHEGASILIAGRNFGCGSSREHAPQALIRAGIRAIIGVSFADIFAGNCAAVGLVAVTASQAAIEKLSTICETKPETEITIDIETMKVHVGGLDIPVFMPTSRRRNFLAGEWDSAATLLSHMAEARATAAKIPYLADFGN